MLEQISYNVGMNPITYVMYRYESCTRTLDQGLVSTPRFFWRERSRGRLKKSSAPTGSARPTLNSHPTVTTDANTRETIDATAPLARGTSDLGSLYLLLVILVRSTGTILSVLIQ